MKNKKLHQKRRTFKIQFETAKRNFLDWIFNTGRQFGFFGKPVLKQKKSPKRILIDKMTNWQNHQWQKSFKGEPKKRNALENVEKFAVMVRA